MKPHPRIRKTVKWGGAVVTVLLAVVWITSRWRGVEWYGSNIELSVGAGMLGAGYRNSGFPASMWGLWTPRVFPAQLKWSCWTDSTTNGWQAFVPIWWPFVPVLVTTCCAWRLDTLARRRARLNLCPKCNYDRTGLAAGAVCPECGQASTTS